MAICPVCTTRSFTIHLSIPDSYSVSGRSSADSWCRTCVSRETPAPVSPRAASAPSSGPCSVRFWPVPSACLGSAVRRHRPGGPRRASLPDIALEGRVRDAARRQSPGADGGRRGRGLVHLPVCNDVNHTRRTGHRHPDTSQAADDVRPRAAMSLVNGHRSSTPHPVRGRSRSS